MPRREHDQLGEREVPDDALHGIHTERAVENFPLLGRPVHRNLARALRRGEAGGAAHEPIARLPSRRRGHRCARTRVPRAARRHAGPGHRRRRAAGRRGHQHQHERERGAGQPRARDCSAGRAATYDVVSPSDHVNLHQSTNDTFPTALRIAAIWGLRDLERAVLALQEAFQDRERAFAHVVKVGRTEMPGRRADDAGPRDGRVRGGAQPRSVAPGEVRGAPARRQPRRHRHRHRPGGAARLHLPGDGGRSARSPASAWRARRTWSTRRRTPTCSSRSRAC